MKFAFFGSDGRCKIAINDATVVKIPDSAFELSDEQWDMRFNLLVVGGKITISPIAMSAEDRSGRVRRDRNRLLVDTVDRINAVRWASMTTQQQAAWRQFRLDLLNIPQQEGFPESISWPVIPD